MTPIASPSDMPNTQLRIRQQFALTQYEDNGQIIQKMREKAARALAEKILSESKFFRLEIKDGYGDMLSDVIVMTTDEFFDWSKRKHKEGFDRAQGFLGPRDWSLT